MEDQGKRLLLAVAVAFAIMLLWNVLFPTAKPQDKAQDGRPRAEDVARKGDGAGQSTPSGPIAASGAGTAATGGAVGSGSGTSAAGAPAAARGPEQTLVLESPQVRAEFSNWGGTLSGWKLLGPQFHVPGQPDVPEDLV